MNDILNQKSSRVRKKASSAGHIAGHQPFLFKGQRGRILQHLRENKGRAVPAYELAKIGLQYAARVCELRQAGFTIENRTERHGSQVHGFYMLTGEPGDGAQATPSAVEPRATLFDGNAEPGVPSSGYPD
jgi:hypothetical protein